MTIPKIRIEAIERPVRESNPNFLLTEKECRHNTYGPQ